MKAKRNISEKGKRLESLKVEPSEQPVAQASEEDLDINLKDFHKLSEVNDILEKLYRTPTPSIIDCEDEANLAYKRANALLIYTEYQEVGLMAEGSELVTPVAGDVMDSIRLQLDIVRLAGKRLFSLCQAKDRVKV